MGLRSRLIHETSFLILNKRQRTGEDLFSSVTPELDHHRVTYLIKFKNGQHRYLELTPDELFELADFLDDVCYLIENGRVPSSHYINVKE